MINARDLVRKVRQERERFRSAQTGRRRSPGQTEGIKNCGVFPGVPVPGAETNGSWLCDGCGPAADYAECRARLRYIASTQKTTYPLNITPVPPCHWDPNDLELRGEYPAGGVRLELAPLCACPKASRDAAAPEPPEYCGAWPAWRQPWDEPVNDNTSSDPTSLAHPFSAGRCFF
jgi:hypothetical protein